VKITMNRAIDLDTLQLDKGCHGSPDQGLCLLEAAAFVAGEKHTDNPACVSPVLGAFGRSINDQLDNDQRQQLKPLIVQLPGTTGDGLDEARGYLALDWLVRTYVPTWLELAGLNAQAVELRAMRRIADPVTADAVGPVVRSAWQGSAAAQYGRAAARWAAGDAVEAATRAAVEAAQYAVGAAGDAVEAAGDAARDAGWDAARAVAQYAVGAAGDAAGDAAQYAAQYAVGAVGDADWDAAWKVARAAAGDALKPTVIQLQNSAIDLFAHMIRPDRTPS
jgi:hypothetical protein